MRVCLKTNSTQEKGVLNKKNKKSEGKGLKFANVRSCRKRCFFCIKKGAPETLNTNLQTNFFGVGNVLTESHTTLTKIYVLIIYKCLNVNEKMIYLLKTGSVEVIPGYTTRLALGIRHFSACKRILVIVDR